MVWVNRRSMHGWITWPSTSTSQHNDEWMRAGNCWQVDKRFTIYARYVVDALLIIKEKHISYLLNQFNNFDKNLKSAIDAFENNVPHSLDIEIDTNEFVIYHKHTQTGQYVHINSYTLWGWKTSWIRSLVIRVKKMLW